MIPDQDFVADLNRIVSDSPKVWFEHARALATLPGGRQMDLRPNGRLEAAAVAIERASTLDPGHIAICAERLIILRYLAHGLSASSNALSIAGKMNSEQFGRKRFALERFKLILDEAVARFPDDDWFRNERQDAYEDFGWNTEE